MQIVPGIQTLPLSKPHDNEPWVGRNLHRVDDITSEHPGPIETPSLVNTPGASPPEDRILEGTSAPPGDGADDMDLF